MIDFDPSREDLREDAALRWRPGSHRRELFVDVGIAALIALGIGGAAFLLDATDRWYAFTRAHESWQIDEIPSLLLGVTLGLAWVAFRQFLRLATLIRGRERERRLRHADKMESLGNLTGGLAHELNNMLLPTLVLSKRVIKELAENDPNRARLERIVGASERAASLVRQMTAFSREEAPDLEPLDLGAVVSNLLPVVQALMPSSVEFNFDIEKEPCAMRGDADQIESIVSQLVKNAVEAIKPEEGWIRLSIHRLQLTARDAAIDANLSPGPYVELAIADSGKGMDSAVKQRIFDPFFTTKAVGMGSGMGLSVVHSFVTAHKGAITVDSTPNRGTTIRVLFPAAD